VRLSWERLPAGAVAEMAGRFAFVLAKPKLHLGELQPGAAARLPFGRDGDVGVRLTGCIARGDEALATVAHGAMAGLVDSAALVTLWSFLEVRIRRSIVPVVLTVLLGLPAVGASTTGTIARQACFVGALKS